MTRVDKLKHSAAQHGIRGPNAKAELALCCPECINRVGKEDTKFKLQANPAKSLWFCYRCEWAGSGDLSWLGDVPAPVVDPDAVLEWQHPPEHFQELDLKAYCMQPYVKYLQKRKVLDQALEVGVGVCFEGKYRGRVILPAKKADGTWWGFSAREVKKVRASFEMPRYLYPVGMPRGTSLWGQDWLPRLKDKAAMVYLVEGCFDALPLYPHVVAAFGKGVTDSQLDLLVGLGHPICVALDSDAWLDAKVIARRLQARGVDASWCRLPPGQDPGDLGFAVSSYIQPQE